MEKARTRPHLFPIGAESALLGVEITKVPSLQERIVAEPNTGNDVAGTESDLFCLSEEFVNAAIQGHFPNVFNGDEVFWPDLCRVKDVKVEFIFP